MSVEDSKDLVTKAQAGDRGAFSQLVERYREQLECLIHLRMGSRLRKFIEADDVFQETILKALESVQDFKWQKSGSFFRWLGAIAEHVIKSLARRHFKTQKRNPHREVALSQLSGNLEGESSGVMTGLRDVPGAEDSSPSKGLRRSERFDRLEVALNYLSDLHREVILLAFIHELPVKEISLRMNRSPDAVSMLIYRALGHLKTVFGNTDSFHLPERSLLRATVGSPGLSEECGSLLADGRESSRGEEKPPGPSS